MKETGQVQCSGASQHCEQANYGLGCYHRKPHKWTNNCSVAATLDTGLFWCSSQRVECKCEAAEAANRDSA